MVHATTNKKYIRLSTDKTWASSPYSSHAIANKG